MKLRDTTIEDFTARIRTTNENAFNAVSEETRTKILKDAFTEYEKYSVQTATSYAIARLKKAKKDESATSMKGIILGGRQLGVKGPTISAFITGRTGIEIQTWRNEVDTGDKKIKLPVNQKAELKLEVEEYNDRKSWWVTNVVARKPITEEELNGTLQKITFNIDDLRKIVKSNEPNPTVVVAVHCKLAGANAMKDFNTDEKLPIWIQHKDKDDKIISEGLNISLRTRASKKTKTMAWIRVTAATDPHGATPMSMEDINEIAIDATSRFENPEDQAASLSTAIEDREVIVIGSVRSITGNEEDGYAANINALFIKDADFEPTETIQGQTQLPTKPEKKENEVEEEKPVEEAPVMEDEPTVEEPAVEEPAVEEPAVEEPMSEEDQALLSTVEKKMLFQACVMRKVKQQAAREDKIAALKTVSLTDLKNGGLMKEFNPAVVETVYNALTQP